MGPLGDLLGLWAARWGSWATCWRPLGRPLGPLVCLQALGAPGILGGGPFSNWWGPLGRSLGPLGDPLRALVCLVGPQLNLVGPPWRPVEGHWTARWGPWYASKGPLCKLVGPLDCPLGPLVCLGQALGAPGIPGLGHCASWRGLLSRPLWPWATRWVPLVCLVGASFQDGRGPWRPEQACNDKPVF